MSIRSILLAVFGLTLSGCAVSDDGRYYGGYYGGGGYSVQRYEVYPSYPVYPQYRVYRYNDDRRDDWHHDRYQERRHHHYAPGHDGRYDWQGNNRRHERDRSASSVYGHRSPRHEGDRYQRRGHERSQMLSRPEQNFSLKRQQIQRQDQSRHEQRRTQGGRSWERRD